MSVKPSINFAGDVAYAFVRGILRGVTRFNRTQGHWQFVLDVGGISSVIKRSATVKVDGLIGQFNKQEEIDTILKMKLPAINISNRLEDNRIGRVLSDDRAIGALAASYFIEKGFKRFAYAGMGDQLGFSRLRGQGFIEAVEEAGLGPVSVYNGTTDSGQVARSTWVRGLADQTAVFTANDRVGRAVIEEASNLGRSVPDQLAVLGVDNDEVDCELSAVPLSSIQLATEKIGYEAGALMADLLAGKPYPDKPIEILPVNVVTRESTDVIACDDSEVLKAVRFIRDNAAKGIQVGHVVKQVDLSRRMLELRFRKAMNRTVHDEIQRVRVEAAKRLLAESDLPVGEIAQLAGFKEAFYLSTSFRRSTGMTPRAYRQQFRLS